MRRNLHSDTKKPKMILSQLLRVVFVHGSALLNPWKRAILEGIACEIAILQDGPGTEPEPETGTFFPRGQGGPTELAMVMFQN